MAVIDLTRKTLTMKIVYYGCAMGGKTTNLSTLHRLTDPSSQQGLVSIATNDDRTLFFDLLPMDLGHIGGLNVKVKLYTVPGQVHYETTRRQVLSGADGVVIVADSSPEAAKSNAWAVKNLTYNLRANRIDPETTPTTLQWNKRDLPQALPIATLERELNPQRLPSFEAVATQGPGVIETFSAVLIKAIQHTYIKHGQTPLPEERVVEMVRAALEAARSRVPGSETPSAPAFDHRFDIDAYRDQQAEDGHDRRIVDESALLSEAVNTNMKLAERLDQYKDTEKLSRRRGLMMQALSQLAPMLADPSGDALPNGVVRRLLEGCQRERASLLLFRPNAEVMDEREVIPAGGDILNASVAQGVGSVAYTLCRPFQLRLIEDLVGEVFFGAPPQGTENLASALVAPLGCDGLAFGALVVYGQVSEPTIDDTEREYWACAARLVGLSLHWHALRRKLAQARAS